MPFKKNDFIELEFVAKTKEGKVFDSSIGKELEKIGDPHSKEAKPIILCLGQGMFLPAVEEFLIGKGIGSYEVELPPEKAFGMRSSSLIQKIPEKLFRQNNLKPVPGFLFRFDQRIGKVVAVSGGRVVVDFNHPLAGKTVIYQLRVLRGIDDLNEKINALMDFLFKRRFEFRVEGKKLVLEVEEGYLNLVKLFESKFKEIFGLDLEIQKKEPKVKGKSSKSEQ